MSINLNFVPNVQVSPLSPPSAAAVADGIILAWKDPGNGFIWTSKLIEGTYWSSPSQYQARPGAGSAPAITSMPSTLAGEALLVWQGAPEAPTSIFMSVLTDNGPLPQQQLQVVGIPAQTPATNYPPKCASFKGMLFVAWIEANSPGGNQIYIVSCKPDGVWGIMQPVPLPDGIPTTQGEGSFALAGDDEKLTLFWLQSGALKWAASDDGIKWDASQTVEMTDTQLAGPAVVGYQGHTCVLAYSGKNNDIFVKEFDGKSWTAESAVPFTHTKTVSYPAAAMYQDLFNVFWATSNGQVACVQFAGVTPDAPPSQPPPLLTWSWSQGFGSGFANANFSMNLALEPDGTAQFSGTWNATGDGATQNYAVVYAVVAANNRVFTFSQTGTTSSSQPWNLKSTSDAIKQNWGALATGTYFKGVASDTADVLSLLGSLLQDLAPIVEEAVEVLS